MARLHLGKRFCATMASNTTQFGPNPEPFLGVLIVLIIHIDHKMTRSGAKLRPVLRCGRGVIIRVCNLLLFVFYAFYAKKYKIGAPSNIVAVNYSFVTF